MRIRATVLREPITMWSVEETGLDPPEQQGPVFARRGERGLLITLEMRRTLADLVTETGR